MLKIKYLIFFLILLPFQAWAQLTVDVVYPRQEQVVNASDSTFIFGSASDPTARVFVNNLPIRMYPNGAFIGVVPVTPGDFSFRCVAKTQSDSAEVVINVVIPTYLTTSPDDTIAIDSTYFLPSQYIELRAGDYFEVAFKGTPGLTGSFTIPGVIENAEMVEAPPRKGHDWGESVFGVGKSSPLPEVAGIYRGGFFIKQGIEIDTAEVAFELRGTNGINATAIAPGRLTVRIDTIPNIAVLTEELTVARAGAGLGYQMFLPDGVKLWITGKKGAYYRAHLNSLEDIWVPEGNLRFLSSGTPIPSSTIELVRSRSMDRKVKVTFHLRERLPFKITQLNDPSALVVSIYGAISNTDWIRYDFDDPMIREMSWSQPANGVYEVKILLNQKQQWGYNSYYDETNLEVEIKRPPTKFSLKNMTICIDPGHGPDDGAVGPSRLKEKDANMQLSLALKEKLEKKGAKVFLTRKNHHGASLGVRTKLAAFVQADVLLSIHHNALPDGVNPFTSRGSSTYYYHPQSHALAAAIQNRLLKKLKLPNFGLYYDNLSVCRITQMPAVLIEPAFIMHPEEEMEIRSQKYKQNAADAIVGGLEDFLKQAKRNL